MGIYLILILPGVIPLGLGKPFEVFVNSLLVPSRTWEFSALDSAAFADF